MTKILDEKRRSIDLSRQPSGAAIHTQDMGLRMRVHVEAFVTGLMQGTKPLHLPVLPVPWVSQGEGHFHLAPQLFMQISGWTRFVFPHAEVMLQAGEAMLIPSKLMHQEEVGPGADGELFCNAVVFAEDGAMSCHLAHEISTGTPDVMYLEGCHNPQALRIEAWLDDASKLMSTSPTQAASDWVMVQARALVASVLACVLRTLDEERVASSEPALITRARVLVQSDLVNHQLSVQSLATQLGCTADYLSHLFFDVTGEHLVTSINRQRMARAATLLKESPMSGKEVAWACGFASQSYFIKMFRTYFNVTPKVWRAEHAVAT